MSQRRPPIKRKEARAKKNTSGAYYLYGYHSVLSALQNSKRAHHMLYMSANAERKLKNDVDLGALLSPDKCQIVDAKTFPKLLGEGCVHQGIALHTQKLNQPDLSAVKGSLFVILDQVTDPHNIGAIMRTALACGADGVLTTDRHSTEETPTLVKSASGAFEHLPLVAVGNLGNAIKLLKDEGFWSVGLEGIAEQTLEDCVKGHDKIALIMGAEGRGLREKTRSLCDYLARIELKGALKSLNVSNAAAIALYITSNR